MSDSEGNKPTKVRVKRVISEDHRKKLAINAEKARAIRTEKKAERIRTNDEEATIIKEIVAERKKIRVFGHADAFVDPSESSLSSRAPLCDDGSKVKTKCSEADLDPSSRLLDKDETKSSSESESESSDDVSSESESSSDDEAEFVLKRKTKKDVKVVKKVVKAPAKKVKDKQHTLLAQLEQMAAELKQLKQDKKKSNKVNVYVNQPEPKEKVLSSKAKSADDYFKNM